MAAILPGPLGTGTEWMNGYRQAQREDKAELDRLRAAVAGLKEELATRDAKITSLQLLYDNSIHHGCTQHEIDRLREAERVGKAICDSYADENQRLSDELYRLRAELAKATARAIHANDIANALRAENERIVQEWKDSNAVKNMEIHRLRAEVKRLEAVQSSCHRDIIRPSDENAMLKSEQSTRNVSPLDDQSR